MTEVAPAIDLIALQYALSVAEQGSFRRTASALGVRTSVISRRIQSLENTIGVSLFQRNSKGVQSTLAGRQFLEKGRTVLSDIETLVRAAGRSGAGTEGSLRIGIVASISGGVARDLLHAFRKAHPTVKIDVIEGAKGDNVARVRALEIDLVLVVGTQPISGLDVLPLWSEPIHVALPKSHPLAQTEIVQWAQLTDASFIVTNMDPGTEIQDFLIRHLADLGRRPSIEPQPVQREGLLALVGLGFGVSLVGTAETAVVYPDVVFRPLADEVLPFSAVWASNNDNPALRRFLSLARVMTKGLLAPQPSAADLGGFLRTRDPSS